MAPDSPGDGKPLAEQASAEMNSEKLVEFLNQLTDLLGEREHALHRQRRQGNQL
jgi:uncharacterized membrane protein YccC